LRSIGPAAMWRGRSGFAIAGPLDRATLKGQAKQFDAKDSQELAKFGFAGSMQRPGRAKSTASRRRLTAKNSGEAPSPQARETTRGRPRNQPERAARRD